MRFSFYQICFFACCISGVYGDIAACLNHTTIDASSRLHTVTGTNNQCDDDLIPGWYKLTVNNITTQIPTTCFQNNACGTMLPLRIDLDGQSLPTNNSTLEAHVCTSYNILGKWDCCTLRRDITIQHCDNDDGGFYVYKLQPTTRCPVAYCAEDPGYNYDNIKVVPDSDVAVTTSTAADVSSTQSTATTNFATSTERLVSNSTSSTSLPEITTVSLTTATDNNTTDVSDSTVATGSSLSTPSPSHTSTDATGLSTSTSSMEEVSNESSSTEITTVSITTQSYTDINNATNPSMTSQQSSSANDVTGLMTTESSMMTNSFSTDATNTTEYIQCLQWEKFLCPDGQTTCYRSPATNLTFIRCPNQNICGVMCDLLPDCADRSDESVSLCPSVTCPESQRKCSNEDRCYTMCDGNVDCSNPGPNEDERGCQADALSTESVTSSITQGGLTTALSTPDDSVSITAQPETSPENVTTSADTSAETQNSTSNESTTNTSVVSDTTPSIADESSTPASIDSATTETSDMPVTTPGTDTSDQSNNLSTRQTTSSDLTTVLSANTVSQTTVSETTVSDSGTSPITQSVGTNNPPTTNTTSDMSVSSTDSSATSTSREQITTAISPLSTADINITTDTGSVISTPFAHTLSSGTTVADEHVVVTSDTPATTSVDVTRSGTSSQVPSSYTTTSSVISTSIETTTPPSVSVVTSDVVTSPVSVITDAVTSSVASISTEATSSTLQVVASTKTVTSETTVVSTKSVTPSSSTVSTSSASATTVTEDDALDDSVTVVKSSESTGGSTNVTVASSVPAMTIQPVDKGGEGLFYENFGLFVFIIVAGTALIAICIFGIVGHTYRQRRLRTWTPRMAYQDAYADMEKKTLSYPSYLTGIESPIPDIDILHEEKVKDEEMSVSQTSTLALSPSTGPDSGYDQELRESPSPESVGKDRAYVIPDGGQTNSVDIDGIVPVSELDEEPPRALFPWIENAADTKL